MIINATGSKGGGSTPVINPLSVTENGVYTAPSGVDGYSPVTVNVSGGGGSSDDDVIFYDYDGTVVESYSADDFANLTAMPANPSHTGLTAQGWNWTLADAKAYVAKYGMLDIGQMYITDDGKTRLYCHFDEMMLAPYLTIMLIGRTNVEIDWGDGSAVDTLTGSSGNTIKSKQHIYAEEGDYVISIDVKTGSVMIPSSNSSYMFRLLSESSSQPAQYTNVKFSNSLTKIEFGENFKCTLYSLAYCMNLQSITLSQSCFHTSMSNAFQGCRALKCAIIPNGITNESDMSNMFNGCSNLTAVSLPKSLTGTFYASIFYACASLKRVTIPDRITSLGASIFYNCTSLTSVVLPDSITGSLPGSSFRNCSNLQKVIIKDATITRFSTYEFSGCQSLTTLHIPSGVTEIGSYAFENCPQLTNIDIPDTVTAIGNYAFQKCSALKRIILPNGLLSIGNYAFNDCKLIDEIIVPNSVQTIGEYAIYNLSCIKRITLGNNLTSMGRCAFSANNLLTTINIPNGITSIEQSLFSNCPALQTVNLPNSVTSIGNSAFSSCNSLSVIDLPNSVTNIGNSAFSYCYAMAKITIPPNVTTIGNGAFSGCYGMAEYHFQPTTPPTLGGTGVFSNIASNCKIYVPYSADHSVLAAYQSATNWSTQASKMVEEEP